MYGLNTFVTPRFCERLSDCPWMGLVEVRKGYVVLVTYRFLCRSVLRSSTFPILLDWETALRTTLSTTEPTTWLCMCSSLWLTRKLSCVVGCSFVCDLSLVSLFPPSRWSISALWFFGCKHVSLRSLLVFPASLFLAPSLWTSTVSLLLSSSPFCAFSRSSASSSSAVTSTTSSLWTFSSCFVSHSRKDD